MLFCEKDIFMLAAAYGRVDASFVHELLTRGVASLGCWPQLCAMLGGVAATTTHVALYAEADALAAT